MKGKHLSIRVQQCLLLAEASECPRRKFGALLLDPIRNVVLMDSYNGGPRGGGRLCEGEWCARDGAPQLSAAYVVGYTATGDYQVYLKFKEHHVRVGAPLDRLLAAAIANSNGMKLEDKLQVWKDEVVKTFIAGHPVIQSGTMIEIGCHHAEMNLICNSAANGIVTRGTWLFITGEPCLLCAKLIHHAAIKRIVCIKNGYAGGRDGIEYLQANSVEVQYVDGPSDPRLGSAM